MRFSLGPVSRNTQTVEELCHVCPTEASFYHGMVEPLYEKMDRNTHPASGP